MDDITDKVALVTGASRGIGRAIAIALARAGANIVVNYRASADEAATVVTEIEGLGRRALAVQADVTQAPEVGCLVEQGSFAFGPVAILVNNAGITRPQATEDVTETDWNDILLANLTSAFLVTQAVLPGMRAAGWGRIINLSSVAAQTGGVVGPHYAASKAGLIGLTHSYASRFAKQGITANAIAPALVETDMIRDNPNVRPDLIPVGRFGAVDEVAEVAVMLARNGYMTGQTLNVNGGWYMS
jgi:3-oxoacyl-[acyl-carrier protein] reductase